jgi:hypothetical protein
MAGLVLIIAQEEECRRAVMRPQVILFGLVFSPYLDYDFYRGRHRITFARSTSPRMATRRRPLHGHPMIQASAVPGPSCIVPVEALS